MKSLILYASRYGTTRQYAEELGKQTGFPVFSWEKAENLREYDQILYFGALYAGSMKGLKAILRKVNPGADLILVTVGVADPANEENIRNIRASLAKQIPEVWLEKAKIFHLRGGIDYNRLSPLHRTMMALLYSKVSKIPESERDAETRALIETYNTTVNFVDFATLKPILDALQADI